jgi:hypothetical protein
MENKNVYRYSFTGHLYPLYHGCDYPILILTSHSHLHFVTVIMVILSHLSNIALRDQCQRNLASNLSCLNPDGVPILSALVFCLDLFYKANLLHLKEEQHHAQKYHICVDDCHNTMQTFPASSVSQYFTSKF